MAKKTNKQLEQFKNEIAKEVGVDLSKGPELKAHEAGRVGGTMVKRMIQMAEGNLR